MLDLPCACDRSPLASVFVAVDIGVLAGCGHFSRLRFAMLSWFAWWLDMKGYFVIVGLRVCLCFPAFAFLKVTFSRLGAGWSTLLCGLYSSSGCFLKISLFRVWVWLSRVKFLPKVEINVTITKFDKKLAYWPLAALLFPSSAEAPAPAGLC